MDVRLLALAAALFAATPSAWSQEFHPALYLPIAASIVRVEAASPTGALSVGSGVTVAPSVVATNCHVVNAAGSVRILGAAGSWDVDAELADVHHDVCFLRVPGWNGVPVRIAPSDEPPLGSLVVALGFTGGAPMTPRVGTVHALHEFEDARVIETDASFNGGASGGGLFDANGDLVGLLAFRLRNSRSSFYALPVAWVRDRAATSDAWQSVRPLSGAIAFWQADDDQLPRFLRTRSGVTPTASTGAATEEAR
jgi:S1-C subfamily serine protease